jgi:hypothetical protein
MRVATRESMRFSSFEGAALGVSALGDPDEEDPTETCRLQVRIVAAQ